MTDFLKHRGFLERVLSFAEAYHRDKGFRARAEADLHGVLAESGLDVPTDVDLRIVADTAEVLHLIMPWPLPDEDTDFEFYVLSHFMFSHFLFHSGEEDKSLWGDKQPPGGGRAPARSARTPRRRPRKRKIIAGQPAIKECRVCHHLFPITEMMEVQPDARVVEDRWQCLNCIREERKEREERDRNIGITCLWAFGILLFVVTYSLL